MNAPAGNLSRDLRERLLASHILGGGVKNIPDPEERYSTAEWVQAAQCAQDTGDFGEIRFMVRDAELWTDYRNSGSDLDFSDWLTRGNFDAGARHPDRPGGF